MRPVYMLRNDIAESTAWLDAADPSQPWEQRRNAFVAGINKLLRGQFPDYEVVVAVLSRTTEFSLPTISMDCWVKGDYNISASRVFGIDEQKEALFIGARPGDKPLAEQVADIPTGNYVLFDDDSATLKFPQYVAQQLWPRANVHAIHLLVSIYLEPADELKDVVDVKDFVLGAEHGGLTIQLPGTETLVRTPYWHPLTNLITRASIPPRETKKFTDAVLKLNAAFWGTSPLTIAALPSYSRDLWLALGLEADSKVADIVTHSFSRSDLAIDAPAEVKTEEQQEAASQGAASL